jgi:general secretion pathway protein G
MYKRGFTLIELLVVIAIIGMLSSIVLASLNTARTKAYDAQRKSNIKSLETAMELYYNDNGTYPKSGTQDIGSNISNLSSFLVPNYIPSIPTDPLAPAIGDQYVWDNSGNSYGLWVYTAASNT